MFNLRSENAICSSPVNNIFYTSESVHHCWLRSGPVSNVDTTLRRERIDHVSSPSVRMCGQDCPNRSSGYVVKMPNMNCLFEINAMRKKSSTRSI